MGNDGFLQLDGIIICTEVGIIPKMCKFRLKEYVTQFLLKQSVLSLL